MNSNFRKAELADIPKIGEILQQAIARRKLEGSLQWQDGYPNRDVVQQDINKGVAYVVLLGEVIIGYAALLINDEPAYKEIVGKWLSTNDFVVVHRIAISEEYLGQGFAKEILIHTEEFALKNNIDSIKVDTNFDNIAMLKILEKLGYTYCGEVFFRGSARKAFEKNL